MPKKGKKNKKKVEEDGPLDVQQKAGTWETGKKEAFMKDVRQRAQVEEERARQREKILKDKLQKEEMNSAKNLIKINQNLMGILQRVQAPKQKEEIAVINATSEREVEELDSITKDLGCKRHEQERQSAQAGYDDQQQMKRLCDLHEKHVTEDYQLWESSILHVDRCCQKKMGNSQKRMEELDITLFAMQEEEKEVTAGIHEMSHKIMDVWEEWMSDYNSLEVQKVVKNIKKPRKLSELCPLEEVLDPDLQREDTKSELELRNKVKKTKNALTSKRTEQQQEKDLIAASEQVYRDSFKLQDEFSKKQNAEKKELIDLTVHSDAASKKLKALIAKGERILQKGDICQELEDRVLSLPSPEIPTLDGELAFEFPELQNLIQQINIAAQQEDTLKQHRQDLIRESQEPMRQLEQLREENSPQLAVSIGPALLAAGPAPTWKGRISIQICHTVTCARK